MLRTLRSPALVVSIIALVVATAGTATAATKILIKSSSQVRAGALDASDLSAKARKALKGNAGPAGPAGPAGAAGPAGPRARAVRRRSSPPCRPASTAANCPAGGCDPAPCCARSRCPRAASSSPPPPSSRPPTFVADATAAWNATSPATTRACSSAASPLQGAGATGVVNDQTVDVTWALTLAAPTTLSLSCGVGGVKFDAANARITALQVGSLTQTVS